MSSENETARETLARARAATEELIDLAQAQRRARSPRQRAQLRKLVSAAQARAMALQAAARDAAAQLPAEEGRALLAGVLEFLLVLQWHALEDIERKRAPATDDEDGGGDEVVTAMTDRIAEVSTMMLAEWTPVQAARFDEVMAELESLIGHVGKTKRELAPADLRRLAYAVGWVVQAAAAGVGLDMAPIVARARPVATVH